MVASGYTMTTSPSRSARFASSTGAIEPLHLDLPGALQDVSHQPTVVELTLGQESWPAARLEQHVGVGEGVQVGDVVARHQDRTLRRDVLQPLEAPVEPQGDGRAQGPLGEAIPGLGSAQEAPPAKAGPF